MFDQGKKRDKTKLRQDSILRLKRNWKCTSTLKPRNLDFKSLSRLV